MKHRHTTKILFILLSIAAILYGIFHQARIRIVLDYETGPDSAVQFFLTRLNADFSEEHSYFQFLDSSEGTAGITIEESYIDRIRLDFDGTDSFVIHRVAFYFCGQQILELSSGDDAHAPDFVWDCTLESDDDGWYLTSTGIDSYVWWDIEDISLPLLSTQLKARIAFLAVIAGTAAGLLLWYLSSLLFRLIGRLHHDTTQTRHHVHLGWKTILSVVLMGLFSAASCILIESANWFQNTWDDIDFAVVMYQLRSPLNGTGSEIVKEFFTTVLPIVAMEILAICGLYLLLIGIWKRFDFKLHVTLFHKEFRLFTIRQMHALCWLLVVLCAGNGLWNQALALGVDEYVHDIQSSSTIFEQEYVDPASVALTFPDTKRNLIFIYMESMETTYASTSEGGGKTENYIPELTELADTYVSLSNTDRIGGGYACALTGWTMAGLLASTSGVPYKIPGNGNSGDQYAQILPGLTTLGDLLQSEGYRNYFLCGSDGEFAGRETYFAGHGEYEILDYNYAIAQGYIPEDYYVFWGYEDEKLYEIAKTELTKLADEDGPFNFTMLTVDTHHPDGYWCSQCTAQYDGTFSNILACASRQVYSFVSWAQQQEWYKNTTIILLGDHNSMKADFWDDIGDYERRTFNCFINLPEDVSTDSVKWREFTTLDLFPTTLAALDIRIEGDRLGLGTNVFSGEQTLLEQLGAEALDAELSAYSKYYTENFVRGK